MIYRGFPGRLYHEVPHWVDPGALFHIRIAINREKQKAQLTATPLAQPDHLHALLSFPRDKAMSRIVGDWKRFHMREHGIVWQRGYFDHRLRNDERGDQLSAKMNYIRQNPVAAGLCESAIDWPWVIERSA